jgi:hypothetical protein
VVDLIRGACEQFKFKIPYTFDQLAKIEITFKQKKNDGSVLVITKTKDDCDPVHITSKTVYAKLNQEETLRFSTDTKAEVQWRALTTDGFPFSSKIKQITVYPTLSETIL